MLGRETEDYLGFPARSRAAEEGVVFTDHLLRVPAVGSRATVEARLAGLAPGVTEVLVHPAVDSPELRSLAADWTDRVDDLALCTGDWLRGGARARPGSP